MPRHFCTCYRFALRIFIFFVFFLLFLEGATSFLGRLILTPHIKWCASGVVDIIKSTSLQESDGYIQSSVWKSSHPVRHVPLYPRANRVVQCKGSDSTMAGKVSLIKWNSKQLDSKGISMAYKMANFQGNCKTRVLLYPLSKKIYISSQLVFFYKSAKMQYRLNV